MGGTYTLLVALTSPVRICFGAQGIRSLDAGWYAYVGSALGSGGFARIDRHRRVAVGTNEVRHWHIDYLLGHSATRIARAISSPAIAAECRIARAIDGDPVDGIGASDCECDSHLRYGDRRRALERSIDVAHARYTAVQGAKTSPFTAGIQRPSSFTFTSHDDD